jgi:ArsR family transcriptional regulator
MGELEGLFKGLADQTRLRIINLLLHGELCVCDIQYVLDSPQPNVSRHLTYLKHSGLVADRREGQRMYYRMADQGEPTRKQLFAFLQRVFAAADEFERDSRKLKKAIERGSCSATERRPPPAPAKSGATSTERL